MLQREWSAGALRALALRFLVLVGGFVEFAQRHVVDGAQQPLLVAARLHEHDEGDGLVAVQGGDEFHVDGGEGLFDHQYGREHDSSFFLMGHLAPAETILP